MAGSDKWISEPMRAAETLTPVPFTMPDDACDSHMHVFESTDLYPGVADAKYTKPEGSLAQYEQVAARLNLKRLVLVQASFYGTDNRCIVDAMAKVGPRARAVVFLPADTTPAMLDDFHARGVRGIRLDLFKAEKDGLGLPDVLDRIDAAVAMARPLGWHVEFYAPGLWTKRLIPRLSELDLDFCLNHMGYMTAADGLTDADCSAVVDLARSERCWVKLTGPYRVAGDADQSRPDWMAPALLEAAPGRMLWGTDWPHIPQGGRDTGALLARFAQWCPDEALRRRVLVENPARFYGFDAA